MDLLTPQNITFVVGMLGVIFSVFMYFRKPQEDLETQQALLGKDIGGKATLLAQEEAKGKASLLAQQVQLTTDANEKKFAELSQRLDASMTLAQNHIHTVDTKVDGLISTMASLKSDVVRLTTIIEERIPRKTV